MTKKATTPTIFQQKVYALCKLIPSGKVITYGSIAQVLGTSSRAVGGALRRNPYAPKVPCHRVIASSLYIGGFSGTWGLHEKRDGPVYRKIELLKREGVKFTTEGKLINAERSILSGKDLKKIYRQSTRSDSRYETQISITDKM